MGSEMQARVARAIWSLRREEEDRCDMELEDMGRNHPVWQEALAAMRAMREPTEGMIEDGGEHAFTGNARLIFHAMLDAEIKKAEEG